jgi:ABC-2 type transport system ATP-binding protein
MFAITSDSLSKTYRSGIVRREHVIALDNVSISVHSGEIFGLLGPNGAGKTTFIKILLSITHPSSGEASILGQPLPNHRVKARVGYLPENHRYPGYMSGEELLRFFGTLSGISRNDIETRIPRLLELVGMTKWRWTKVKKYSKGMMQRIGLAQALMNDPEVIFLDEPTDGVDPVGRKEIRDILKELRHQGKTVFLNSHLLSEVELVSDRVAILDKGRLLKIGTIDEFTTAGSEYRIGIEGELPESFSHETSALLIRFSKVEQGIAAEIRSTEELNSMIDLLRRHGIRITSIARQRNSLEESFLNLIKREVTP